MLRTSLLLAALALLACGPTRSGPTTSTGSSSSTSSSTGGVVAECQSFGNAGAGAQCATDCDCCAGACTTEHVCAAPCAAR